MKHQMVAKYLSRMIQLWLSKEISRPTLNYNNEATTVLHTLNAVSVAWKVSQ